MRIELKDFAISGQTIIDYCRSVTPWIKCSEFTESGFMEYLNTLDLEDSRHYSYNFDDAIKYDLTGHNSYNQFYYKVIKFFQEQYNMKESELEESMLYCIYLPLFKNPHKYEISKNVYEFNESDIHLQLFLMKRGGLYKNAPAFDNFLVFLNNKNGEPKVDKEDREFFIETLKAS